jgi:hypothetical protein
VVFNTDFSTKTGTTQNGAPRCEIWRLLLKTENAQNFKSFSGNHLRDALITIFELLDPFWIRSDLQKAGRAKPAKRRQISHRGAPFFTRA